MISIRDKQRQDGSLYETQPDQTSAWEVDKIRGLATAPETRNYWQKLRGLTLTVLVLLLLFGTGKLLQRHLPEIVNLAVGIRESVADLKKSVKSFVSTAAHPAKTARALVASDRRKPAAHKNAGIIAVDLSSATAQPEPSDTQPNGPFWAVAVVGDRQMRVTAKKRNVLVDIPTGAWTWVADSE